MSSDHTVEIATLAGGCFWCLEAIFQDLRGVLSVTSGYAGGHVPHPTYEQVCQGTTGHAEVVQITYHPQVISFSDLLEVFFNIHDPTTLNRQGGDIGSQYRSAVFYSSPEQRRAVESMIADLEKQGIFDLPIVTEIVPLTTFYPAEAYHKDYYSLNPNRSYCRAVIAPKIAKFRRQHVERLRS